MHQVYPRQCFTNEGQFSQSQNQVVDLKKHILEGTFVSNRNLEVNLEAPRQKKQTSKTNRHRNVRRRTDMNCE